MLDNLSQTISSPNHPTEKKTNVWNGTTLSNQSWEVHCGDALKTLKSFEDQSFNCCVTSPPYFWLRDYGVKNQIGKEETIDDYVDAITNTMSEINRVLKSDGLLFLNLGDTYYSGRGKSHGKDKKSKKRRFGLRAVDKSGGMGIGLQKKSMIGIPWRVALSLMENGWALRSTIVWHRDKCLPEAVRDRPRRSYEFVFMFSKSRKYYFDREPLITQNFDEDVWTIPPERNGKTEIDTAPYPAELVRRCLSIGCRKEGKVIDPFAGSGTTLSVAMNEGFSATGIELNEEFCKYMVNQLNK
ncbi:MAG: site-specific DNA-methyltransferase [Acidobacteriota bacterium]|jgi:DNA modification methylase|nr:site-specific DNA-methyltransferase [Acidobacteriota bacterium]